MPKRGMSGRTVVCRSVQLGAEEQRSLKADRQSSRVVLALAAASALSLSLAGQAWADNEIAGWDLSTITALPGSYSASSTYGDPNLSAPVVLSEGAGMQNQTPNYGFGPGLLGASSKTIASLSSAQSNTQYYQFTLTPTAGDALNIDSINIAHWYNQNGKATTIYVTDSLDGYANSIGSVTANANGLQTPGTINLGSALQNVNSAVTIQLDVVESAVYTTFGLGGSGSGNTESLQVFGSVAAPVTPVTWSGVAGSGGNGIWNTSLANTWNATSGGAPTLFASNDPVTFDDSGVNTNISVDPGGVNPGAITFVNNSVAYAFSGGSIGGTTATTLTVNGTGSVTLASSNTYAGGTTVNSGTLTAANDTALETGAVVVNGGILNFTSAAPSIPNLSGTGGSVVLLNTTLTVGSDNTSTSFAGNIGQAPSTSGGLVKTGTGTLSLSGSNSYAGGTTINAGTLLAVNTTGSATGSGSVTVASGAILGGSGFIGNTASGTVVTIQAGGILAPHITPNGFNTLTINGALNLSSGSIMNFNLGSTANDEVVAQSVDFSGSSETLNITFPGGVVAGLFAILQAGSFTGQGSPVFTINGPSSENYAILAPGDPGNTFANAYALSATLESVIWTNAAATGNWNTTDANWNGTSGQLYVDGHQAIFDNSSFAGTPGTQTVTVTGTVTPGSVSFNNTLGYNYVINPLYNFGSVIAGPGAVSINGTGTVTFGGPTYQSNTYSGGTFLNAGVLNINDDDKLGAVPTANAVNLTFNGGALQLGGTITDLSGKRSIQLNAGGGTIDTNSYQFNMNGNLIAGPGALMLIGGGVLKFNNGYYNTPQGNLDQNTYSGGTVIDGTTVEIADNGAGAVVTPAGASVSSVFGTGPIAFKNGATVTMDNWQDLVFVNPVTLNGAFNYNFNWTSGDSGHGLVFATADINGNAMATPNVTTIAAGGTTLNLAFTLNAGNMTQSARMAMNQQVVGGLLTVNTLIDPTHGTGYLELANSSNTFSGLTLNSGLIEATGGVGAVGTGPVTVNSGGIIFSNTTLASVFGMLQSGYNNGNWNGSTGINSTAAATDPTHLHAVGMYQPPLHTTFSLEGQNVNTAAVAIKYTYYGDANLDGQVSSTDYTMIDAGYLSQGAAGALTGWQNGDFNYDGVINGSDYTLIDNAFNTQGAQIASQVASVTAQIAGGGTAVPEPASLGLLALGAIGLLSRRKATRLTTNP